MYNSRYNAKNIIKREKWDLLGTVKTDKKRRVSLSGTYPSSYFQLYRNDWGQFILDPQVLIPAIGTWPPKSRDWRDGKLGWE